LAEGCISQALYNHREKWANVLDETLNILNVSRSLDV